MTTHKATFTREDDGKWSVSAPDVPGAHSWGRSLNAATLHIREAIASILDSTDEEFEAIVIDPTFHVGDTDLDELLIEAQKTRRESRLAQQLALEVLERAVEATLSLDLSMRDMAEMTEVTHSRIQQIGGNVMSNRDTYKYDFVDRKGRIIHSGITYDLDRREGEHKRELSSTGHIRKVGNKTTRTAAREWEKGKRKA